MDRAAYSMTQLNVFSLASTVRPAKRDRRTPMQDLDRKSHWESIYTAKDEREVSWFEESPALSLELIAATGTSHASAIIDIGGGAAHLADALLERGYSDDTILDLAEGA